MDTFCAECRRRTLIQRNFCSLRVDVDKEMNDKIGVLGATVNKINFSKEAKVGSIPIKMVLRS